MSFIEAGINRIEDQELKTALQERLDIVQHKIKFMDKVPVACLDTENKQNIVLRGVLEDAGGLLQEDPAQAKVLIYHELGTSMLDLMGIVPSLLHDEWPSVEYNRVYLMNDQVTDFENPEIAVSTLEDIAEMLYPGSFVFGNEGKTWSSFGV
jgi:iron complex transport system substrate-binding protein